MVVKRTVPNGATVTTRWVPRSHLLICGWMGTSDHHGCYVHIFLFVTPRLGWHRKGARHGVTEL